MTIIIKGSFNELTWRKIKVFLCEKSIEKGVSASFKNTLILTIGNMKQPVSQFKNKYAL